MKKPTYRFQSKRLGFRTWTKDDLEAFAKLNADEAVMEHFPNTLSTKEVEDFIEKLNNHFEENGYTYFATEVLDTQEFIGMIGLAYQKYKTIFTPAVDIGWRLKQAAWGKGYATEGAKRCLDFAFDDLGLESVIAICTVGNSKSENVMRKIGMTKIGEFFHPEIEDHPVYAKHFCYKISKL